MRKLILLFVLFAGGCSIISRNPNEEDIFIERAYERSLKVYENEWLIQHTMVPYAAELMRLYLKQKGINVPDTTWFDYGKGKEWVISHKDMFKDTVEMQGILSLFHAISQSSGVILSNRIERARFEWEMDLGKDTLYWYASPRKIMAVFLGKLIYFRGPFCNEGKNKRRVLVAFPSDHSGRIKPINSPYYWEHIPIDSVLIFFYEGRWDEKDEERRKELISFGGGPAGALGSSTDPNFSQFVEWNCIRYMRSMYFLKDGMWYFACPFSIKLYNHPTDAIAWNVADDPSFYMWGKSKKDYYWHYQPPFSNETFHDVMKFLNEHIKDVVGKKHRP